MLYIALKNTPVNILYGIDRKADSFFYEGIQVYSPSQEKFSKRIDEVDVVVIAAIVEHESIKDMLKSFGFKNVCSIFDVVNGI